MKSFNEYTKFQKVTVKDKSGKSHTQQTRIRPGTTHVALIHYKARPKTTFASATPAHTDMNFGTEKSLEKPVSHAMKRDGKYITGDVTDDYLQLIEESRSDTTRTKRDHTLDLAEVSTYV